MSKHYFIGTRGSLLAQAQSHLIKKQLETLTEDQFHLKVIKTEGDIKTQTPLWQLEGKDFFTKELDQALLNDEIDLAVHSYKDLGHIRPPGITLTAITERAYGEDILLIGCKTLEQLSTRSQLLVGTSSPRRIAQITGQLAALFPASSTLHIVCKMLRGNINTRLQKLLNGEYDAIVLALAGPERLALHPASCKQLQALVNNLNYMILPSSLFPSAAAQGALGIEIKSQRRDGGELAKKLQQLHHAETAEVVQQEREHFQRYGGGCHLAVGFQVEKVADHFVHFQQGKVNGRPIARNFIERDHPRLSPPFFLGLPRNKNPHPDYFLSDQLTAKVPLTIPATAPKYAYQCSFVTSPYCFDGFGKTHQKGVIFTSGLKTWKDLAQKGYWINGCADGLGHKKIYHYLDSRALALLHGELPLVTYSARYASAKGELIACYQRKTQKVNSHYFKQLRQINTFFWTSYPQFELFKKQFADIAWEDQQHCCGMGKTFQEFKKHNIKAIPFISTRQFILLAKNKAE